MKTFFTLGKFYHLMSFKSLQVTSSVSFFNRATLIAGMKQSIVFEMCLYGFGNVENWGKNYGHIWRTTGDIKVVLIRLIQLMKKSGYNTNNTMICITLLSVT